MRAGVVHGDISPGNILMPLIRSLGGSENNSAVRIADFEYTKDYSKVVEGLKTVSPSAESRSILLTTPDFRALLNIWQSRCKRESIFSTPKTPRKLASDVVPDIMCPALENARPGHDVQAVASGVRVRPEQSRPVDRKEVDIGVFP